MAILSWGKPGLYLSKVGEDKWKKLPDPVENSTVLTTTKGDKVEARVEGGENEGVRYGKNTYSLAFNIRAVAGRKKPVADSDGIIDGEYKLALVPENPSAPGLMIDRGTLSIEDTWSAADGGIWNYTLDALKPDTGDQVKWGKVVVAGTDAAPTITFTEDSEVDTDSE